MSEKKTMVKDLTTGNITRLLLAFALPLFVSNALQAIYNIVDMVVVGQYIGGAGMSAVSTGGDVLHLMTFVAMGFSSAGQVLIARDVGAGRQDMVRKTIGSLFTLLLSASVLMALGCFLLRVKVLDWLNTPAEAYGYTMDYVLTCISGLPFIYGYNVVSAILRGMGDSKRPFVFIAVAAVLNMALDLLFVCVFDLAVFGAALATVIGQGLSFLLSMLYLYKNKESFGFDFKPASFRPEGKAVNRLMALGIPMSIQSVSVNFSKIVLTSWINMDGVTASALAGIYNKTGSMAGIVSQSFTTAGSSMIGQNLGAGKTERVPKILKNILAITLGMFTLCSLGLLLASEGVYALFTGDVTVLAAAHVLTWPIILNFYGSATRSGAFSLINGSGNTRLNLAVALIDGLISRIGIAALLYFGFRLGALGCWYGDALAGFMPFCIGGTYFLSGKWKSFRQKERN